MEDTPITCQEKNTLMVLLYSVLANSSGSSSLTADVISSIWIIWQGSFLSFKQCPFSHFFLVGNEVFTYFEPACVLLTPHQGASRVSK